MASRGVKPEIGKFTVHGDGQRMVIIDKDAAYRLVATRYPDLMPAGSKEATVSRALWNEQLTVPEGVEPGSRDAGSPAPSNGQKLWAEVAAGSRASRCRSSTSAGPPTQPRTPTLTTTKGSHNRC
jgi:hypothetical protein